MKAITLWQPYATFIALGIKDYETRSWRPSDATIGQRIAILAAKRKPTSEEREDITFDLCAHRSTAFAAMVMRDLPLGAIVCTAR